MARNSHFKKQLEAKRSQASAPPPVETTPIEEMTESELDLELEAARQDLRRAKEAELAAAREAATASPARPRFLPKRTPRRYWKYSVLQRR